MSHEEVLALLTYMLDHNRHHADELHDICHALEDAGKTEAAAALAEALHEYDHGNSKLEKSPRACQAELTGKKERIPCVFPMHMRSGTAKENLVCSRVCNVSADGENVTLTDLMGIRKVIPGKLKKVDLMSNVILIEAC